EDPQLVVVERLADLDAARLEAVRVRLPERCVDDRQDLVASGKRFLDEGTEDPVLLVLGSGEQADVPASHRLAAKSDDMWRHGHLPPPGARACGPIPLEGYTLFGTGWRLCDAAPLACGRVARCRGRPGVC